MFIVYNMSTVCKTYYAVTCVPNVFFCLHHNSGTYIEREGERGERDLDTDQESITVYRYCLLCIISTNA